MFKIFTFGPSITKKGWNARPQVDPTSGGGMLLTSGGQPDPQKSAFQRPFLISLHPF